MAKRRTAPPAAGEVELPQERTLPHSIEAEKALLGAIIVNNATFDRAITMVKARDFYRRAHQTIFECIAGLLDRNGKEPSPVDILTLKTEIDRIGQLDECGGISYISGLTDGVPRSTNIAQYANIVKEHATRRGAIKLAGEMLTQAYDRELPAVDLINKADLAIIDLQRGVERSEMADVRESQSRLYADIEWFTNHPGELRGIDTGFASINELTLGWQRGDMIVIGARPSIGKTMFTLNTAVSAAKTGKRVAIFSLEMRTTQLEFRMLASLSGVQLARIKRGQLGTEDYERLGVAMGDLSTLPIFISDRGGQTVGDIRAACRRMRAEGGLDLVVIDYIQLVAGSLERRGANRNDELTDISHRLKWLAAEVDAPVIVLSQLSRAGDSRSDKRPILSDLRESGALEQDADIVAFLHRKHHRESGTTMFILEKQRNGEGGTVNLSINRDIQRFVDEGMEAEQASLPEESEAPAPAGVPPAVRQWRKGR